MDFLTHSKRWGGCSATIVPTENYAVWGVIWELHECNMTTLDNQEGVADKLYFPLTVDIETINGELVKCRVYQQCNDPDECTKLRLLSKCRRPSPLYVYVQLDLLRICCRTSNDNFNRHTIAHHFCCRGTILKGAEENKLPCEYIKFLKTIPHNEYTGDYDIG